MIRAALSNNELEETSKKETVGSKQFERPIIAV